MGVNGNSQPTFDQLLSSFLDCDQNSPSLSYTVHPPRTSDELRVFLLHHREMLPFRSQEECRNILQLLDYEGLAELQRETYRDTLQGIINAALDAVPSS